ncbi:MAG: DEAD/DEAH box helicase [Myxococcales bacterium]|nr:DEAD/DEAH box helicase [Myxococcales bacterium]MCB9608267.1 DEAD/DEAH box helicase [Polyangiaceae bacterium]
MLTLRPYQREAVEAVIASRRAGVKRQVVCLPTGAGKTVIFSELARLAKRPVLVLAHRRELVDQAREKLERALGGRRSVGVEQGAEVANTAEVVVASIRSLHEQRLARVLAERRFGLIVYDECHHAPAQDNQRVLQTLGAFDENWDGTLLGFTATTSRGDGMGLDQVFERIVYKKSLADLIREEYLVPLRGYRIATAADLVRVSLAGDDLNLEELAEAVDIESRNELVARSIQELARDRRSIVFCVNVKHARNLARALNAVGIPTGIVHGEMKPDRRRETLEHFRTGNLSAITNVGVLTEGFDDPGVSCVAMARPTRSEGLYAQCVGRGTRLAPGKSDCLVLDFVDLSELSLVGLPTLAGLPNGIDLEGTRLDEAAAAVARFYDDNPGFEIDPGAITLAEIQRRAASFDPLSRKLDDDIRALTPNAWFSLGAYGLGLHAFWSKTAERNGRPSEVLILDQRQHGQARGKRWRVTLDGRELARFSRLEEAVEATDYELAKRGRVSALSALPQAGWRSEGAPPWLTERLALTPKPEGQFSEAITFEAALRLITTRQYYKRR